MTKEKYKILAKVVNVAQHITNPSRMLSYGPEMKLALVPAYMTTIGSLRINIFLL